MIRQARSIAASALGLVVTDQVTKWWVLRTLDLGESVPVIPGVFHVTLVRHPGVAFGLLAYAGGIVVIMSAAIVTALVLAALRRTPRQPVPMAMGWILGGAVGNLLDRLRLGGVIDFLDFRVWPVFNVADSGITIGALLVVWGWWSSR